MSEASVKTDPQATKSVYTRATIVGLLLLPLPPLLLLIINIIEDLDDFMPILIPAIVLPLIVAGLVWRYGRWALIAAVIVGILAGAASGHTLDYGLSNPDSFFDFVPGILLIAGSLLTVVGGIVAFIQRRRASPRAVATRAERGVLGLIVAVVLVFSVLSVVLTITGGESVAAEDRVGAIELGMSKIRFVPDQLDMQAGLVSRLVIDNGDLLIHTFTIDQLDIDHVVGPDTEVLIELPSLDPGTYIYTCEVHGHEDMKGTLTVR